MLLCEVSLTTNENHVSHKGPFLRHFNNKVAMWKKYLTFKYLMCFFAVVLAVVNLTLFGYHIYREANTAFKVSHDTTYLMV